MQLELIKLVIQLNKFMLLVRKTFLQFPKDNLNFTLVMLHNFKKYNKTYN
jgi:hypothetical protein